MFTGLIDHCGCIHDISKNDDGKTILTIKTKFSDLILGESIAVDGVCLTVTSITQTLFECELSPETFNITIGQYYHVDQFVNLERALRLSDRLGGHIVTGHVDQIAVLSLKQSGGEFVCYEFSGIQTEQTRYLTKKGSIAINGVSLTVNDVFRDGFQVMLIPHTLSKTNLSTLNVDDFVNIEFDWLSKQIGRQLEYLEETYVARTA